LQHLNYQSIATMPSRAISACRTNLLTKHRFFTYLYSPFYIYKFIPIFLIFYHKSVSLIPSV
jgi:hypothetical protein